MAMKTCKNNSGFKSFCGSCMSAQTGVGIFVRPCLAQCVTDWIAFGGRVCLHKLRLQDRSLCILLVYAPNAEAQYQSFLDEVGVALQKVRTAESIFLLGDSNKPMSTEDKTWKYVIGRQGDSDINRNGRCLIQFYTTIRLCIMNNFFWHKEIYKCTWYRDSVGKCFTIDFCSADLVCGRCSYGAVLPTDHHLVVCILRSLNHSRTRKQFRTRRAYRIK